MPVNNLTTETAHVMRNRKSADFPDETNDAQFGSQPVSGWSNALAMVLHLTKKLCVHVPIGKVDQQVKQLKSVNGPVPTTPFVECVKR